MSSLNVQMLLSISQRGTAVRSSYLFDEVIVSYFCQDGGSVNGFVAALGCQER